MSSLKDMDCVQPRKGAPPLEDTQIAKLQSQVAEWEIRVVDGIQRIQRSFSFDNFAEALAFTNKVGKLAEEEDHHPMLVTEWGKVTVVWWTHAVRGLHKNDFIMAAKTDALYR